MSLKAYIPPSRRQESPGRDFTWIGKSMKRVEDPRILAGKGVYIDDVVLPNMAHAAVLRSPYAHATIKSIDKSEAEALPGVLAVVTGEDSEAYCGALPTFSNPPVTQYPVARDRVRHVGETVVAVVAEDRYIAEDALDLIEVEYDPLPVVSDLEKAVHSKGAEVLHPELGDTNVFLDRNFKFGPVDDDFERADLVVSRRLRWNRSGGTPIETSGAVGSYDAGTGGYTIHSNMSAYNWLGYMLATTLNIPSHKLNLIPVLAGGSFGAKFFLHKVPVLTAILSRAVGRPVKFIEDRLDNTLSSDHHGSDRVYYADLALNKDGTFLALRSHVIDDYGAYMQFGIGHHGNALAHVIGPYRINSAEVDIKAVLTNKCQQGAYRGFGSEVANFVLERMVDMAADELSMDRIEIRRKNFIQPDEFPYLIPSGNMYDSGNYPAVMEKALGLADVADWRARQQEARKEGRYIGIGVATCQERSVLSATEFWMWNEEKGPADWTTTPEAATVAIDAMGKAIITLHGSFWGNSPETVATQLLAEQLSIDPADILVIYSDKNSGLPSMGPAGSRFTVMIAGAIVGAASKIRAKMLYIASHLMQVDVLKLELVEGEIRMVGGEPGPSMTITEIAYQAHNFRLSLPDDPELTSGLDESYVYDHPATTEPPADRSHMGIFYPIMGHSCHIPVVEVDIETGQVSILKYIAVHDCGTIVNPITLDGHIRGGTVNGIGTALLEHYKYNDDGQLESALFTDYLLPSVHESPEDIICDHVETPSPFTEYGIKGGGEGGRMGAPPAIVGAIEDALRPLGVKIDCVPVGPARLKQLIREARKQDH